jgi:hypothetical protein
MRRVLLLFLLATFSCNQKPSKTAQTAIKKYMQENINDLASYTPVRFGELDNDSTDYSGIWEYTQDSIDYYNNKAGSLSSEFKAGIINLKEYSQLSHQYHDKAMEFIDQAQNYLKTYKPKPTGFSMMHVFRKKIKTGAIIIDSMNFLFDSNYVLRVRDYYRLINNDH